MALIEEAMEINFRHKVIGIKGKNEKVVFIEGVPEETEDKKAYLIRAAIQYSDDPLKWVSFWSNEKLAKQYVNGDYNPEETLLGWTGYNARFGMIDHSTLKFFHSRDDIEVLTLGKFKEPTLEQESNSEVFVSLKEKISLEMTKDEVQELLGKEYTEVRSAMDDREVWRYDYGGIEGYRSEEGYDFADLNGLKNGSLNAQMFINWSGDNKVQGYSFLYLEQGGKVHVYYVLPDGSKKEDELE